MAGDECIREDLLGLTFRISPHAFFQVTRSLGSGLVQQRGESIQAGSCQGCEVGHLEEGLLTVATR